MSQFFPSGGGGGGGGATIDATTNLIKGDGAGNGADSGIVPSTVILGAAGTTANVLMVATGSGNGIKPSMVVVTSANALVPVTDNSQDIGELFPGKRWLNGFFSGTVRSEGGVSGTLFIGTGGWYIYNIGDGIARITNSAGTDFDRFQLGGTTASFPALQRNGASVACVLASEPGINTLPAAFSCGVSDAATNTVATGLTVVHATTNFATIAGGFGVSQDFVLPSDNNTNRVAGQVVTTWVNTPDTNESSFISLRPMISGALVQGLDIFATGMQFNGVGLVLFSADTGWTANADGGDKTSVIPANATLDAMQAALNLVVAGFGDAFVAVADKCKAIETALAAKLVPNA